TTFGKGSDQNLPFCRSALNSTPYSEEIFRSPVVEIQKATRSTRVVTDSLSRATVPGASFPANDPAFPPVNGPVTAAVISAPRALPSAGAASLTGSAFGRPPAPPSQPGPSDECMSGFVPLREDK